MSMISAKPHTYAEIGKLPSTSGVYTAWTSGEKRCHYVGSSRNLRDRIKSHFSGQRGSDQYCLYVYDHYLHALKKPDEKTPQLNKRTSNWVRRHVTFRFVELPEEKIDKAETILRTRLRPLLNPASENNK
jgi:hypothetical protein